MTFFLPAAVFVASKANAGYSSFSSFSASAYSSISDQLICSDVSISKELIQLCETNIEQTDIEERKG